MHLIGLAVGIGCDQSVSTGHGCLLAGPAAPHAVPGTERRPRSGLLSPRTSRSPPIRHLDLSFFRWPEISDAAPDRNRPPVRAGSRAGSRSAFRDQRLALLAGLRPGRAAGLRQPARRLRPRRAGAKGKWRQDRTDRSRQAQLTIPHSESSCEHDEPGGSRMLDDIKRLREPHQSAPDSCGRAPGLPMAKCQVITISVHTGRWRFERAFKLETARL